MLVSRVGSLLCVLKVCEHNLLSCAGIIMGNDEDHWLDGERGMVTQTCDQGCLSLCCLASCSKHPFIQVSHCTLSVTCRWPWSEDDSCLGSSERSGEYSHETFIVVVYCVCSVLLFPQLLLRSNLGPYRENSLGRAQSSTQGIG